MLLERTEHPSWLSNAYLLADGAGGQGVLVDANGVAEPLLDRAAREEITLTHVLLTHGHPDHVEGLRELADRLDVPVHASAEAGDAVDLPVEPITHDDAVTVGALEIRALATPGHAPGHLSFLVGGTDCFTGDVLFRRTVGGTRGGGRTGFADLRSSILERLLTLPPETRIHPGHREATTVAEEGAENVFVRVWRGVDPEGEAPCRVRGEDATLVVWGPDYDGGHKAWVRFASGEDAIVGGSQVERE